jgi:hypothetical protein
MLSQNRNSLHHLLCAAKLACMIESKTIPEIFDVRKIKKPHLRPRRDKMLWNLTPEEVILSLERRVQDMLMALFLLHRSDVVYRRTTSFRWVKSIKGGFRSAAAVRNFTRSAPDTSTRFIPPRGKASIPRSTRKKSPSKTEREA